MWFLNDSIGDRIPGDVTAYESKEGILNYVEYWFTDYPHLVFDHTGRTFKIHRFGQSMYIVPHEPPLSLQEFKIMVGKSDLNRLFKIAIDEANSFLDVERILSSK